MKSMRDEYLLTLESPKLKSEQTCGVEPGGWREQNLLWNEWNTLSFISCVSCLTEVKKEESENNVKTWTKQKKRQKPSERRVSDNKSSRVESLCWFPLLNVCLF
jgi:hypothetical protein